MPLIGPRLAPMPRGCGRSTRNPSAASLCAIRSKSSAPRPRDGSSTISGPAPSSSTSICTSPREITERLTCASALIVPVMSRPVAKAIIAAEGLRPGMNGLLQPCRHCGRDLVAVLLQHHHVAVATDAAVGKPQVGGLDTRLAQIFDRAVVVARVIGGFRHHHQHRNAPEVDKL